MDIYKNHLHYEVCEAVPRIELSDLETYVVGVPLHLEDGCHPIHTVSSRFSDQDGLLGHAKCS